MTPTGDYKEKCRAYRDKCRQHLHRAALARNLAISQIKPGGKVISANQKLVDESLGGKYSNEVADLEAVITKTHFLLLKVEFEFFLKRITYCLWDHHFEALLQRGKARALSDRHTLEEFAGAVARGEAKEYVLRRLVPHHGLDAFEHILHDSAGIPLPGLFQGEGRTSWCQIRSAFHVRHLIEHANGMVDEHFESDVLGKKKTGRSPHGEA